MKKLKIIFNLITLALTTGLLVMITVAWYAVNKQASVEAGTGSVADLDNIVETVEYYNFKSAGVPDENTSVVTYTTRQYVKYTFGMNETREQLRFYNNEDDAENPGAIISPKPTVLTGYDGKFKMNEFDFLHQGLSKYLIRITLKQDESLSSIQFVSNAAYFIGYNQSGGNGIVTDVSSLSLSSVVKFGKIDSIDDIAEDHSTVQFNDSSVSYMHFIYNNSEEDYSNAITTSKQTVASSLAPAQGEKLVINLLVDYNINALNAFYGNNLSTSGNWTKSPVFDLDFRILILG